MRLERTDFTRGNKKLTWVGGVWTKRIEGLFPLVGNKNFRADTFARAGVKLFMAEYSYECFKELRRESIELDNGDGYVSMRKVREVLGLWDNKEEKLPLRKQ